MSKRCFVFAVIVMMLTGRYLFAQTPSPETYWIENTKHDNIKVLHLSILVSPRSDERKGGENLTKFAKELNKIVELRDFQLSAKEITLEMSVDNPSLQSWEFLINKVLAKFAIIKRISTPKEVFRPTVRTRHQIRE
jgi:hypothetical protein